MQPFIENACDLAYNDPGVYLYSTIGDMSKPSQALGYLYAPPATPDCILIQTGLGGARRRHAPTGESSVLVGNGPTVQQSKAQQPGMGQPRTKPKPKVIFAAVSCTKESFQTDVFVGGAASLEPSQGTNPAFISRITRLGMAPERGSSQSLRNAQLSRKAPVTRVLDATPFEVLLQARAVKQVVTHLGRGEVVDVMEWRQWPGLESKVVWL